MEGDEEAAAVSADHPKHKEIWGEVDDPDSVFIHLKATDGFWWEY